MAFTDVVHHAPALIAVWALALIMLLVLIIFYAMQGSHMNGKGSPDATSRMGNAVGIVGILLCVVGLIWGILLIAVMRDSRNIWHDASSIYVSRSNIVASFHNKITEPDKAAGGQVPISSANPSDWEICYGQQFQVQAGPNSFDVYKKLIAAYSAEAKLGGGVDQTYLLPDGKTKVVHDTIDNQQMMSLAYYRFLYCNKQYMMDILGGNKDWSDSGPLGFLKQEARTHLQNRTSCLGPTKSTVPDTIYCTTAGWPRDQPQCGQINPCYVALQQSIAAQCLLYDDHVYRGQHTTGPLGALAAFDVEHIQVKNQGTNPFQVPATP